MQNLISFARYLPKQPCSPFNTVHLCSVLGYLDRFLSFRGQPFNFFLPLNKIAQHRLLFSGRLNVNIGEHWSRFKVKQCI